MTQSTDAYVIADSDGATVLAAIAADLQALVTANAGPVAPSTTFPGMLWLDTTSHLLRLRDEANASWILLGPSLANYLGNLPTSGGSMTGAINEGKVVLAALPTTAIGAAAGNYLEITGSGVIIAGFDTAPAGASRMLVFDAINTLSQNATSLILPNAASKTTAAGDIAQFRSEGGGNWRMVDYQYAAQTRLVAQANFDGTQVGTCPPRAGAFNIASIVKNGFGNYTFNFTNALPANYTWALSCGSGAGATTAVNAQGPAVADPTTMSFQMVTTNSSFVNTDSTWISASFFG